MHYSCALGWYADSHKDFLDWTLLYVSLYCCSILHLKKKKIYDVLLNLFWAHLVLFKIEYTVIYSKLDHADIYFEDPQTQNFSCFEKIIMFLLLFHRRNFQDRMILLLQSCCGTSRQRMITVMTTTMRIRKTMDSPWTELIQKIKMSMMTRNRKKLKRKKKRRHWQNRETVVQRTKQRSC